MKHTEPPTCRANSTSSSSSRYLRNSLSYPTQRLSVDGSGSMGPRMAVGYLLCGSNFGARLLTPHPHQAALDPFNWNESFEFYALDLGNRELRHQGAPLTGGRHVPSDAGLPLASVPANGTFVLLVLLENVTLQEGIIPQRRDRKFFLPFIQPISALTPCNSLKARVRAEKNSVPPIRGLYDVSKTSFSLSYELPAPEL